MEKAINILYVPIHLGTLRLDTIRSFDIFIKIKNKKMVLYHAVGEVFTPAIRENLLDHNISTLYIRKRDRSQYLSYIEDHLSNILADSTIETPEKAQIITDSITNIAKSLFEKPRALTIKRYKSAIFSAMDLVMNDDEVLSNLIRLTSHDFSAYYHSINVGIFSIGLAKELLGNDPQHNLKEIAAGFFLHDIGKSLIPFSILNKRSPLTEKEWITMKRHPENGYRILEKYEALSDEAKVIVLQHHERHDGQGYPYGIKGDNIHIYSKICCIADVFDALTSDRPFKKARGSFEALTIMKNEMLGEFDPDFFARFIMLFRKKKYTPKGDESQPYL